MTNTIGYARVSTFEQILDLQRDALTAAQCDRIFTDTMSGSRSDRPGLEQALDYLREGDVLVVWRLDRLGRSLKYLIEVITALNERGVGFKSLTEQIDTTTSGGKLIFHVFGALAEFERDIIRERTQAGIAAARARADGGQAEETGDADEGGDGTGALRRREPLHRRYLQESRCLAGHTLSLSRASRPTGSGGHADSGGLKRKCVHPGRQGSAMQADDRRMRTGREQCRKVMHRSDPIGRYS